MNVRIVQLGENETVAFAASEAVKYLRKLDKNSDVALEIRDEFDKNDKRCLWIGLPCDFKGANLPEFNSEKDSVYIAEKGGCGIISGSNPRSVLFSVYRMLKSFGCFFDRPGEDGEFIPEINIENTSCNISESAFYDFRSICIEGGNTYKNVEDMIDWMTKMEMNMYYIQFFIPEALFNQWYDHPLNKHLTPDRVSNDDVTGFIRACEREIKKRDLLYHAVGHGWTLEPFGFPTFGEFTDDMVTDEQREYLAMLDGTRHIRKNRPLFTQLCYGNEKVRNIISDAVVDYAKKHKNVDYLAFDLGDNEKNFCECPLCMDLSPSDHLVRILNEIDEKLTINKLDTKIEFSAYCDRIWPPEKLNIKNPKRFIFLSAPITRTYSESYDLGECKDPIPVRIHNVTDEPRDVKMNLKMTNAWTKVTGIPVSIMYEYHYMWDHICDPGYMQIARILAEDIKNLKEIPSKGFESCQLQRAFLPHALGMHILSDGLWRGEIDFDSYAKNYFNTAYGNDGEKVMEYMSKISEILDPKWLRKEVDLEDKKYAPQFEGVYKVLSDFYPTIEENSKNADSVMRRKAWEYLKFHSGLVKRYADAAVARAKGDIDTARAAFDELSEYVGKNELSVQSVFEAYNYLGTVERRMFTDANW